MTNQILSKLQTSPGDPLDKGSRNAIERDGLLTESLRLIRKVISGRRSISNDDVPDIVQEVALRLWKWRTKFEDKSSEMETAEWRSFTARTAHNEVNRTLSNRNIHIDVPIDEVEQLETLQNGSSAETLQLVESAWQGICRLSLYQRQALLFSSIDLVVYLLQYGVEEDNLLKELAVSPQDWKAISLRMPLSDDEIAVMANRASGKPQNGTKASAVKKARFDARKRLKELMK